MVLNKDIRSELQDVGFSASGSPVHSKKKLCENQKNWSIFSSIY